MDAGVEVKPGKPYTHRYKVSHGRLRICQVWVPSFRYFPATATNNTVQFVHVLHEFSGGVIMIGLLSSMHKH